MMKLYFFDFRKLNMCELKRSDVPDEILSIEQGNSAFDDDDIPPELANLMDKKPLCRSNQRDYIKAYTTMVHLEEAAQSEFIAQFNTENVRLMRSNSEREFRIRNSVRLHYMMKYIFREIFVTKTYHIECVLRCKNICIVSLCLR